MIQVWQLNLNSARYPKSGHVSGGRRELVTPRLGLGDSSSWPGHMFSPPQAGRSPKKGGPGTFQGGTEESHPFPIFIIRILFRRPRGRRVVEPKRYVELPVLDLRGADRVAGLCMVAVARQPKTCSQEVRARFVVSDDSAIQTVCCRTKKNSNVDLIGQQSC